MRLSRRDILKGSAVAGLSWLGFSRLFNMERILAQDEGDKLKAALNLLATAETFTCTHYYTVLTDSNVQLTPGERAYVIAMLDADRQHLELLNREGARTLAQRFYTPTNVYRNRANFSTVTEQIQLAVIAAYLAADREFSESGDIMLGATMAQIAAIESVHLALVRQLGDKLPNLVSLGQALYYNTSQVMPVLQPFIEGGNGLSGPKPFPGADAITRLVNNRGVTAVKAFADFTVSDIP